MAGDHPPAGFAIRVSLLPLLRLAPAQPLVGDHRPAGFAIRVSLLPLLRLAPAQPHRFRRR